MFNDQWRHYNGWFPRKMNSLILKNWWEWSIICYTHPHHKTEKNNLKMSVSSINWTFKTSYISLRTVYFVDKLASSDAPVNSKAFYLKYLHLILSGLMSNLIFNNCAFKIRQKTFFQYGRHPMGRSKMSH